MAYIEDIDGPYPTLTVADREVAFARFRAEQEGVLRMFFPDVDEVLEEVGLGLTETERLHREVDTLKMRVTANAEEIQQLQTELRLLRIICMKRADMFDGVSEGEDGISGVS